MPRPTERTTKTVYPVWWEAEKKRFANANEKDNQRCNVFRIAKQMVITSQDIISEQ